MLSWKLDGGLEILQLRLCVDCGGVLCRDEKTSVVIFLLRLGMEAGSTFGTYLQKRDDGPADA